MTDYHISVFFSEDDSGWMADMPDLPGCSAYGDTPELAVSELGIAKVSWLETARAEGRTVPDPTDQSASTSD